MTDDDLKKRLSKWTVDKPDDNFADMIVQNAVQHPQKTTLSGMIEEFMYKTFSDWQSGIALKFASLAICALFGLHFGWNQASPQDEEIYEEIDIVDLAFMIPEEDESL